MGEWVTLGVLLASEMFPGFHVWILDLLALLESFVAVYWFKVSTANKPSARWKAAFGGDAAAQQQSLGLLQPGLCSPRLQDSVWGPSRSASSPQNHHFWQCGSACALRAVAMHWHYPAWWGGSCSPSLEYEVVKAVIQESNWAFNVNPSCSAHAEACVKLWL